MTTTGELPNPDTWDGAIEALNTAAATAIDHIHHSYATARHEIGLTEEQQ